LSGGLVRALEGTPTLQGQPKLDNVQTRHGWHGRFGMRFDDVDFYYTFPSVKLGKYLVCHR
jgi:hypothetical protein